ncbi:MAG: hypothetical protein PHH59_14875, partial [Methylovulum sp.]|uniref:hypothetical protein n=1 Tax=Methylovulum sp. TaxID=1916980 RepID=UPI002635475B
QTLTLSNTNGRNLNPSVISSDVPLTTSSLRQLQDIFLYRISYTITQLLLPASLSNALSSAKVYVTRMLMLPTGQVLLGLNDLQLWVYTPDAASFPSLRPLIDSVTYSGRGQFLLTGKRLTGQSAGGSYGDDVESDQNYPIVQLKNGRSVYYAKTTNWSTTDVGTGRAVVTTNFCLKPRTPAGTYSMVVSAAGLKSAAVTVTIPSRVPTCP